MDGETPELLRARAADLMAQIEALADTHDALLKGIRPEPDSIRDRENRGKAAGVPRPPGEIGGAEEDDGQGQEADAGGDTQGAEVGGAEEDPTEGRRQ